MKTNKIIELRNQGMTYDQISKQLNVSHNAIAKVLKENNMLKSTVYTPQTVLKIKSMLNEGENIDVIAEELGVLPITIVRYIKKC